MPTLHADYAYRRIPKSERRERQPGGTGRVGRERNLDPGTLKALRGEQEGREHTLLQLARAERGLRFHDRQALRQHKTRGDNIAVQLNNTGISNLEHDNLARAFRNFRAALDRDPDLVQTHNNLGLLNLEIGDHEKVGHHLARVVALDGELDIAYSNRGLLWTELGEYESALKDFERAIELDPYDAIHLGNEGVLFLQAGAPDTAVSCFQHAIELDPHNPMHLGNIGMAYRETGNPELANRSFMRAIELANERLHAHTEFRLAPNQSGLRPGVDDPGAMKRLLEDEDAERYLNVRHGER